MNPDAHPGSQQLRGPALRSLKARAQRLEPILKIGKAGLTDAFFAALDDALNQHELIKIRFEAWKDQKKELTPRIVERSHSQLILRVGNTLVLYRPSQLDNSAEEPIERLGSGSGNPIQPGLTESRGTSAVGFPRGAAWG